MDKLNAISVFCKVIETQSFTQTAQLENISVAMVSKLVAQLEEHLQTRLLHRTTRKISPTEAGLVYYQHCQPILTELNEADASISDLSSSLQGNLLVSVPMDFGLRFIAPNLAEFAKINPNLHIEIDFSDRRVDLMSEGYDLALRIGNLQDSSLVAKKLATTTMHFVASPDYLAKQGSPQTPTELQSHDCLLYKATGSQIYWEFTDDDGKVERIKMQSKLVSNNGLTLVEMAKAGLGIINQPYFLIEKELATGELVEVLTHYKRQTVDLHAIYPHRRYLSAKVKAFINFLQGLNLGKLR
ncbi:LysR family transcriptional regulator [Lonepinella koalarum]|uniref:DNA-binding transcriptional LysR family regulator n=1 Tax=Lonepinella koalarum TaxID=53417 RepID=A0A4R1KV87_9PAST|nr:LysR family transcriptional regulator [Lonepinella koalarum]MDH2927191.1 LysR family transcriptional regulator [Lonepinella koalarum]TCK68139.1 DNA-binding transcriptional LysR family regulator [Lonepinella koalarum]TFJ89465.1 LysR family transcriptional regulator [Lonepinella koalarum]TYG33499.1 LysR family transcriptional regulator [Lonepinella koalarum]